MPARPPPALPPMNIHEAAAYCGLTVSGLRWHIHQVRDLTPDGKLGRAYYFTAPTLDDFLRRVKSVGAPTKAERRHQPQISD